VRWAKGAGARIAASDESGNSRVEAIRTVTGWWSTGHRVPNAG
jgi:hypothetical protein